MLVAVRDDASTLIFDWMSWWDELCQWLDELMDELSQWLDEFVMSDRQFNSTVMSTGNLELINTHVTVF